MNNEPKTYIFFDSKWKLHDGELPVKPTKPSINSHDDLESWAGILTEYNQAIADIKANALEIDNPELLDQFLVHQIYTDSNDEFGKWPGGYETDYHLPDFAHLVLPPEEKNMKTEQL